MPRLNSEQIQQVTAAEETSGDFQPLPEGPYKATLVKVEERAGREYPYWNVEFTDIEDAEGTRHPGRQWFTVSTSPKSAPFMKAFFLGMGFTPDSDTDEMIGEEAVIHVKQEVQEFGVNAGKVRNTVSKVTSIDNWV